VQQRLSLSKNLSEVTDLSEHQLKELESYYDSGSLSGFVRSGIALIGARRVRPRDASDDEGSSEPIRDKILFYVLVVCPAVLLTIFHRLREALLEIPWAFENGTWQFYLQFGLREDLGHHTNETVGYQAYRASAGTESDDLTAWVLSLIQFVWGYEDLMGLIWEEATYIRLVDNAAYKYGLMEDPLYRRLGRNWEIARPYEAPLNGTYTDVRRRAFYEFIEPRLIRMPAGVRTQVEREVERLQLVEKADYQRQMSLLARMRPGRFLDDKVFIPLWDASIGVVFKGQYYFIYVAAHDQEGNPIGFTAGGKGISLRSEGGSLFSPEGDELTWKRDQLYLKDGGEWFASLDVSPIAVVKAHLDSVFGQDGDGPFSFDPGKAVDILLAETPRSVQGKLRKLLPADSRVVINRLHHSPIILNWDEHERDASLAELRRTQRGIGDHAITVIRTKESMLFDQHHAFFDGTWAAAMAEVLTNVAVQWHKRVQTISTSDLESTPAPVRMVASPDFIREAEKHRQIEEIAAETTIPGVQQVFELRKMLNKQGTNLTVNDLLVIARIFHAAHYRPSANIQAQIDTLRESGSVLDSRLVQSIERSLERGRITNPALLIPVDATLVAPKERIFPITFRNISDELVWAWDAAWESYQAYRRIEPPTSVEGYTAFHNFKTQYEQLLMGLQGFSHILAANKSVALRGKSINVAVMMLLCKLPPAIQYLLRSIPEQFPVLNEVIRGDEVYSNIGRVAAGSSLTRFISAKDDGNTKALVWGIMTDDEGQMVVTMRDFRPHVKPLVRSGYSDLAREMARDYVVSYTTDLISLVARLSAMMQVETPKQI